MWRRDNISGKKVLGSVSELSGVSVWRAGPFSIHTLELRFKRQIFMIFIVDYIYQKRFLKSKKFKFVDNPVLLRRKKVLSKLYDIDGYSITKKVSQHPTQKRLYNRETIAALNYE